MEHILECPICLNTFKEPVCLPCGHLYCRKCLTRYINAPTNKGLACGCPDCRAPFFLVTPDLDHLPKKYHPFIRPAVRRVYLHTPNFNLAEMQEKLEQAEQRLAEKTTECDDLRADCTRLAANNLAYSLKNAEMCKEKEKLVHAVNDLEVELYRTTEGRQANETQALKEDIIILELELHRREEQLKANRNISMAMNEWMRIEIADLEHELQVAHELININEMETNGISVTINDLELDLNNARMRLHDHERLKEDNRELRTIIKDIGRKKERAEECLREIGIVALSRSQPSPDLNSRKRALATQSPGASGPPPPTKDLPKRRRVRAESEGPGSLGSTPKRPRHSF